MSKLLISMRIESVHELAMSTGAESGNACFLPLCSVPPTTGASVINISWQEILKWNVIKVFIQNNRRKQDSTLFFGFLFFERQWSNVTECFNKHLRLWGILAKAALESRQFMLSVWTNTDSTNGQATFLITKSRNVFERPLAMTSVLSDAAGPSAWSGTDLF